MLQYPPDTEHGTLEHFMPNWVLVFASHDGSITFAGPIGTTWSVVIDHDNGWASQYGNLEQMFVTPTARGLHRARVRAGDALGYVGATRPGMFKTLHFELWNGDDTRGFQDVDPMPHLSSRPATSLATGRTTSPTTGHTTSPATSFTTSPATRLAASSVTGLAASLTTSPTTGPTTSSVTSLAASLTTSPTTGHTTSPATSFTTSPATGLTASPTTSPATGPRFDPHDEPRDGPYDELRDVVRGIGLRKTTPPMSNLTTK